MLTVSCEGQHDKIKCTEEEIILTGPPSHLTGFITFQNKEKEEVFIKDLPLSHQSKATGLTRKSIEINAVLSPDEMRSHFASFSANPDTPPGTYQSVIEVGGKKRKLKIIVQENMDIQLMPSQVTFFGIAPGMTHQKEILLVNKGNIPIAVPNVKHNTMLDMDLICRNLSLAIRETGEEGTEATLDYFIKGLKKDITGWVEVKIKEAGQLIPPGASKVLHLSFKLPRDVNEQRFYEGDLRILDQELEYRILQDPNPKKGKKNRARAK